MGGCLASPCCAGVFSLGQESRRFVVSRRASLGDQVGRELRHSATPQRVESLLRLFEVRGSSRSIQDFYEKVDVLGTGYFGSVSRWRSKNTLPGTPAEEVAVKFVEWTRVWHGLWKDPEQEELVRRELKMLMVLDNPFIIRVREWFEDPGRGIYFVQELCDGGSLQDYLDRICGEPVREVRMEHMDGLRGAFRQVTYALQYLHQLDPPITHCDLKPDNVLFSTKDSAACAKLIDFGLVSLTKHEAHETLDKWTKGTQIFMAPEQFLQVNQGFTTQMDIWALGIIFCWMITACEFGRLRHPALADEDDSGADTGWIVLHNSLESVRDQEVGSECPRRELFTGHSEGALELAAGMLKMHPDQRWTARDIMQHAWVLKGTQKTSQVLCQESVAMNLRMYSKLEKLERVLLHLVAGRALARVGERQEIILSLRQAFLVLDTELTGSLSAQELLDGLRPTWGATKSEAELHALQEEIALLFEDLSMPLEKSASFEEVDGMESVCSASSSQTRCEFGSLWRRSESPRLSMLIPISTRSHSGLGETASPSSLIGRAPLNGKKERISYTEFVAATIGSQMLSVEEYVFAAFHELDASNTGSVTLEDLEGTIGLYDAKRLLGDLEKEELLYDDFKEYAAKVAQKRWGIVPCIAPNYAPSPRSRLQETGISPTRTLSGDSFSERQQLDRFWGRPKVSR